MKKLGYWVAGVLFCAGELAAAPAASMKMINAGNNTMGGVYVNPYTATIDGVSTQVICDDFKDETYVGETWTADVYDLQSVVNGGITTRLMAAYPALTDWALLYQEAAYLAVKLMNASNSTDPNRNATVGQISFALWGLFDPTALSPTRLSATDLQRANEFKAEAQNFYDDAIRDGTVVLSNISVYSPQINTARCGGGPCPTAPPQEMLVVKMPEPAGIALLVVDLSAVAGLICIARRRRWSRP